MSETSLKKSRKKDNKLLTGKRSEITFVERSIREERPKLDKGKKKEYEKQLGGRAEPRERSGWDDRPLGKDGIPASEMRYRVYEEMRSRDYKGRNIVAEMFGVSKAFVTDWTKILRAAHELGAGVRNACIALPTRPPSSVRSPVADGAEDVVLQARKRYPFLGPEKIKVMFGTDASPSTIGRIIRKFGFQREHKPYKKHKYVRFQRPFPLYTVQLDYKDWAEGVHSIWALDDRSRMILGHRAVGSATAEVAIELVKEIAEKYGTPIQVLTDHGAQFTTMHEGGEHIFDDAMKEMGIKHIMGRVKHPQTQGKIERSHGSAKTEMGAVWGGRPETLEDYREAIGAWVEFHNSVRVHQSLDYETPSKVFFRERIGVEDPAWIEAVGKEFPNGPRVC